MEDTVYIPSFKVSDKPKTGIDFYVDFYAENGFYPYFNVWLYVYKKSFLEGNNLIFKEGFYHEDVLFSMCVFFYATKISVTIFNSVIIAKPGGIYLYEH